VCSAGESFILNHGSNSIGRSTAFGWINLPSLFLICFISGFRTTEGDVEMVGNRNENAGQNPRRRISEENQLGKRDFAPNTREKAIKWTFPVI
jgi:hypothetical protein